MDIRDLSVEDYFDETGRQSSYIAARGLLDQLEMSHDEQTLNQAIEYGRRTLALSPVGSENRGDACGVLGRILALALLYEGRDTKEAAFESDTLLREAVSLCPDGHPSHARHCSYLANSLSECYRRTADDNLLVEGLDLLESLIAMFPRGHPNYAVSCGNMASLLHERYEADGNDRYLMQAIEFNRKALAFCPREHPRRAICFGNLAVSLKMRYERTGDDRVLIEAIELNRKALELCDAQHLFYADACMNLANTLRKRYVVVGGDDLLLEAVDLLQESLKFRPRGHPNRAMTCGNLSNVLSMLYRRTGDITALDEAIELQYEALALCPKGLPDRGICCGNLATSLRMRYKAHAEERTLNDIRDISEQGKAAAPKSRLWIHTSQLAWVYLQHDHPCFDIAKGIQYLSDSMEHEPDSIPQAITLILVRLDDVWAALPAVDADSSAYFISLLQVYQQLIRLLPFLSNPALETQMQLQALRRCRQIGSDAFVCAAYAGTWPSGLEMLEVAQGRLWSQRMQYRDPQLAGIPSSLALELEVLLPTVVGQPGVHADPDSSEDSQATSFTIQDMQHNRSSRLYSILREIRALPGLEDFMIGETSMNLCSVATEHPAVVLVSARGHSYALILASNSQEHALLPLEWSIQDHASVASIHQFIRSNRGVVNLIDTETTETVYGRAMYLSQHATSTPMLKGLKTIWLAIVKPVLDHLNLHPTKGASRPRLHWCPTGVFCALPLHAAGIYDGPQSQRITCADYVVSSYTPTLTSLLRANKTAAPLTRAAARLVLVAEKQGYDNTLQVIDGVNAEIAEIATVANSREIEVVEQAAGQTLVSTTCDAMTQANIVHLACHGIQDSRDATNSGFCLRDGRLTILKLMEMRMDHAFLAFLSACETAKGDEAQPDQVMHLAAAMLFSGFKTVIATMWAISDSDGPMVAKWFYEELFTGEVINTDAVAYALDVAVGKLRDSGVPLHRWAPFIHMGA